jgi:hypothetical protein
VTVFFELAFKNERFEKIDMLLLIFLSNILLANSASPSSKLPDVPSHKGTIVASEIYDGDMATVRISGETAHFFFNLISKKKEHKGMSCTIEDEKSKKPKYQCWFLLSRAGEISSPGSK